MMIPQKVYSFMWKYHSCLRNDETGIVILAPSRVINVSKIHGIEDMLNNVINYVSY
jgi:hypothetical protein